MTRSKGNNIKRTFFIKDARSSINVEINKKSGKTALYIACVALRQFIDFLSDVEIPRVLQKIELNEKKNPLIQFFVSRQLSQMINIPVNISELSRHQGSDAA